MTQQTSGFSTADGFSSDPSTTGVAREQAGRVGRTTSEAGQRVADTAAEQAGQVGQEARRQARDLLGQAQGQLTEQARNGQQQASEGLQSLARELREMADGGDRQGPASDLAAQAADKLGELADWLGRREPGDLIEEVRALARRRPGAFLLGAAAAGVLAGRLTRGAVDARRDSDGSGNRRSTAPAWTAPPAGRMPGYSAAGPPPDYTLQPTPSIPGATYSEPGYGETPESVAPTPPEGLPRSFAEGRFDEPTGRLLTEAPGSPQLDAPVPTDVGPEAGRTLPPRTAADTVGEYVEQLDRDVPPRREDRPHGEGPR